MSILSLFVVIPALMLLGLWLARNLNQVRGVMVVGASCLLALSIWLTIYFIQQRAAGNQDTMLLTYAVDWFKPLNIKYSVGVDGISVVMLLLSSIIVFTGTFASWQLKPLTKEPYWGTRPGWGPCQDGLRPLSVPRLRGAPWGAWPARAGRPCSCAKRQAMM